MEAPEHLPAAHLWPTTTTVEQGVLAIAGFNVLELVRTYGTPLYVLDGATIRTQAARYTAALRNAYAGASSIHYASKALLNVGLAQLLARLGLGLDVVSAGELQIAKHAGCDLSHVHLHGNGTPAGELQQALELGVGRIVVDNLDQLAALINLTKDRATPQPILLRIAPDVADTAAHTHIQTGAAAAKFGLPIADGSAAEAVRQALKAKGLHLMGLHAHIGSQLRDWAALREAVTRLITFAAEQRAERGWTLSELSPGGGLAVAYLPAETAPDIDVYATTLAQTVMQGCTRAGLPLPRLIIEPGRSLIARAGVSLYSVTGRKAVAGGPTYVHVDGGMGDNLRPALYAAGYTALVADQPLAKAAASVQISGRFCESGDVLIRDVALPPVEPGAVIALPVTGAYTLSMSSNYNGVPRPPLLLLDGAKIHVLQRRETIDDLLRRDLPLDV